ncbi:MAG: vitamin K epoxide reductase family protein [bacterium]|nr:vitamin K epoxide reductase family protein [bacterium]
MSSALLHSSIILCSFGGLCLAAFIYFKKRQPKPLVCPIGHSCDPVVHSDYSRFMTVPVEILGIGYYAIIAAAYAATVAIPALHSGVLGTSLLGLSAVALLFSLYLTAIQAFVLKEWCTWCLISAGLCAIIFFTGLMLIPV